MLGQNWSAEDWARFREEMRRQHTAMTRGLRQALAGYNVKDETLRRLSENRPVLYRDTPCLVVVSTADAAEIADIRSEFLRIEAEEGDAVRADISDLLERTVQLVHRVYYRLDVTPAAPFAEPEEHPSLHAVMWYFALAISHTNEEPPLAPPWHGREKGPPIRLSDFE